MPLDEIRNAFTLLPREQTYITYCRSGRVAQRLPFCSPSRVLMPAGSREGCRKQLRTRGSGNPSNAMNATSSPETPVGSHVARRLIFLKDLQSVTNRIHATHDLDELMLDLPQDICKLFNADRLTLYVLADAGQSIVSRVKTGLHSTKDLKLPVGDQSIAGYVAANRKTVNIRDVYDDEELSQYSPHLQFLKEVDRRTGYRSRQMLVSPILDGAGELLGVVQLINSKDDQPFPAWAEEGVKELSATLAVALTQRQRGPQAPRSRYDGLVSAGVLAASELEDAHKRAREHEMDLESVLIQHFKVKPQAIGESLAEFFRTSYEPFKPGRIKPVDSSGI